MHMCRVAQPLSHGQHTSKHGPPMTIMDGCLCRERVAFPGGSLCAWGWRARACVPCAPRGFLLPVLQPAQYTATHV